jgi:hypothetical protein
MIRSLSLPPDFEECCKILSTFDNIQRIDVTAAIMMASNDEDSKSKFRILLNAAEMGLVGEIIDKPKLIRNQIPSRLISTITNDCNPTYVLK